MKVVDRNHLESKWVRFENGYTIHIFYNKKTSCKLHYNVFQPDPKKRTAVLTNNLYFEDWAEAEKVATKRLKQYLK